MNDLKTKTTGNDIPDDGQFRAYYTYTPKRAKQNGRQYIHDNRRIYIYKPQTY